MAQGSKKKYTSKQKRKAGKIEKSYEKRGVGKKEAERRAWATVNKSDKGGKKSGSGRGKKQDKSPIAQRWTKGKKSGGRKKEVKASIRNECWHRRLWRQFARSRTGSYKISPAREKFGAFTAARRTNPKRRC